MGWSLVTKVACGRLSDGLESDNADADPPAIWGRLRDAGKQSTYAPARSAGVVGTARWKGGSGNRARPHSTPGGSWPPVMSPPRAAGHAPMGRREPAGALSRLRAPVGGPS